MDNLLKTDFTTKLKKVFLKKNFVLRVGGLEVFKMSFYLKNPRKSTIHPNMLLFSDFGSKPYSPKSELFVCQTENRPERNVT